MSTPTLIPDTPLAADPRPLPLSAKLLYGVGEMPITVLMVISGLFMLFFYNSVMGLPSALVGVGLSFSLVVDAVLDPFIGHLSDRTSHRFGRRHIFMLPGALIVGRSRRSRRDAAIGSAAAPTSASPIALKTTSPWSANAATS